MPLPDAEAAILAVVAETILPRGGVPSPSAADAGTTEAVVRLLDERVPPDLAQVVRLALRTLDLSTLPRHMRRFSHLTPDVRRQVLDRALLSRNPIVSGRVSLLKHLIVNSYLDDPALAAGIGYRREAWLDRIDDGVRPPALTPLSWPEIPPRVRCDVVVVGSGAGGAPVATALAEGGLRVVVVEEGRHHDVDALRERSPWDRFVDLYRDLAVTGTIGRPPIPIPVGRAVGGTTIVNAGTCFRPPERVLEQWEQEFGLEGLLDRELQEHIHEVEATIGVEQQAPEILGRNAEVFRRGVAALGDDLGEALSRNCPGCRGCGEEVVGCPLGRKQSTQVSWLPRAERAGAQILAGVRVDRIVHADGRVHGLGASVLDEVGTVRGELRIDAEIVVVAAGALHTPGLLERSCVPDPGGQRGRNLQIHPAIGVAAEMEEEVRGWEGVLQSWGVGHLMERHGIMIEATAAPPSLSGGQMPFVGAPLKRLLAASPNIATTGFLIEDSTAGRVWPSVRGRSFATYQLTKYDLQRIAIGFAWSAEALLAAGARRVLVGRRGQRWASRTADIRRIREEGVPPQVLKLSAYHPVGTHRIAADPGLGPSDPWGAVRAVDGLWVADASSLPTCIGVNPQVTIMALALRTAREILSRHGVRARPEPGRAQRAVRSAGRDR